MKKINDDFNVAYDNDENIAMKRKCNGYDNDKMTKMIILIEEWYTFIGDVIWPSGWSWCNSLHMCFSLKMV